MERRETAMPLGRREVEQKSQKVEDLQRIIREFDQMAADLERQIQIEENRTGVRDRSHFSYSMFATAAAQRRDNLMQSAAELREKLAAAVRESSAASRSLARRGDDAGASMFPLPPAASTGFKTNVTSSVGCLQLEQSAHPLFVDNGSTATRKEKRPTAGEQGGAKRGLTRGNGTTGAAWVKG